jgi:hypothetical protein
MMSTRVASSEKAARSGVGDLFFLRRLPLAVLAIVGLVVAALALAAGYGLLRLQIHYTQQQDAGQSLNVVAQIIADGSGWLTVWPGWVAALCFLIAVLRLQRAGAEPPPGLAPVEKLTVHQLRSGLRAEYRMVRVALVLLTLVAAIDTGRALAYVRGAIVGNTVARHSVVPTVTEAAGLLAAAILLVLWAWYFRRDLQRWGAIS